VKRESEGRALSEHLGYPQAYVQLGSSTEFLGDLSLASGSRSAHEGGKKKKKEREGKEGGGGGGRGKRNTSPRQHLYCTAASIILIQSLHWSPTDLGREREGEKKKKGGRKEEMGERALLLYEIEMTGRPVRSALILSAQGLILVLWKNVRGG